MLRDYPPLWDSKVRDKSDWQCKLQVVSPRFFWWKIQGTLYWSWEEAEQCLCLNYRIRKVLVSGFVSRDWQPARKLICPFWFWFKRLHLESDMSNCPERKWHRGWIPTSLALCYPCSQDSLTTWTLALLCRSIPLTPHSAIEKPVSVPPGKGRITYGGALLPPSAVSGCPEGKPPSLDLRIWSSVLTRVHLHPWLTAASPTRPGRCLCFPGVQAEERKGQKRPQTWCIWGQV